VCGDLGCQRRRRAEYHRQKIAADPDTTKYAWTAHRNGGLATGIIGGDTANGIRRPSSATASSSTFETRNGICAILQTTTQFST
jgi:hypothetical protein